MRASDIVTAVVIMLLAACGAAWTRWVLCLVGVYLFLAPLIFWAKSSTTYVNDTLIGIALITFSQILPGLFAKPEPSFAPRGWSYNPSSYSQRLPVAFLAFFCCLFARYMGAYELGYIHTIWDPLFPNGTLTVITSDISKAIPVADAGLGAAAYAIEMLMAVSGSQNRWYQEPWLVALFGFLVVPVGLVSIVLIMLQPIAVGAWCFWCLCTALCMLIMIALTVDEVAASWKFLRQECSSGAPFWKTFIHGKKDIREVVAFKSDATWGILRGVSMPWTLVVALLLGLCLLFIPSSLSLSHWIIDVDTIVGALITTVSVIASAEIIRKVRYFNVVFACLLVLCLAIGGASIGLFITHSIVACLIIVFSLPQGVLLE